jgi:uncharacterized protein (TIGR02597 family)
MNPSKRLHLTAAALCALAIAPAFAQTTATSTPAGFVTLACPANSDTRISTPLTRPPAFTGAVTTPLPGAGGTVTVSGSPNWSNNQFGPVGGNATHYAIFGPAASSYSAEGKFFTITGNGANTLILDLQQDDISSVPANAQVQVIPYWTLATVFPPADAGVSFIVSGSAVSRQTEILIPNHAAAGTNAAPAITYFFFNGGWRRFGQPVTTDFGPAILPPTENFIVRNKAGATSLVNLGGVEIKKVTTPLATLPSGGKQDNFVSIVRPVDVAIQDLGLIASGAFIASTSAINRTDELLVFNNASIGTNKAASATYFFFNGAWRKFGQPVTTDFGTDVIPAGAGFVIRKAQTAGGTTAFWVNDKTYNP